MNHRVIAIMLLCLLCVSGASFAANEVVLQKIVVRGEAEPQIERGRPNLVFDALGNVASVPQKIIFLNANIGSHTISPKTEQYIRDFIRDNPQTMRDVKVRLNQCTPIQELDRLVKNKRISLLWRIFPGIPVTIWSSLTGRILGGDNYNPYTNTISIYSDDPAVVLHEASHAKDFMSKKKGLEADAYAIGRIVDLVVLYQEYTASDEATYYLQTKGDREAELNSYATLYSAFGTYGGAYSGLPYGSIAGAILGRGIGLWKRHEREMCYNSMSYGEICRDLELDPLAGSLLRSSRAADESLNKALL